MYKNGPFKKYHALTRLLTVLGLSLILAPAFAFADSTVTGSNTYSAFDSIGYDSSDVYYAYKFVAPQAGTVDSLDLGLQQIGTPPDLDISLQTDSGGSPDGTPQGLVTVGPGITLGCVGGSRSTIALGSSVSLSNGATYWIVMHIGGSGDSSNRYQLCGEGGAPSGTSAYANSTPSWINTTSLGNYEFVVHDAGPPPPPPPPPPSSGGIMSLIDLADQGFGSTTGFTAAAAVTWTQDNLIRLFIGSGMAVLYNLRYWIMALLVIASVVYFAFRAFMFFRH